MIRKIMVFLAICLCTASLAFPAYAGKGSKKENSSKPPEEVPVASTYPGSKSQDGTQANSGVFYAKDSIDQVKAYYEKEFGTPFTMDESSGTICRDVSLTFEGKQVSRNGCVKISSVREHDRAFSEMDRELQESLPQQATETDREFHAACEKYKDLADAYFEKSSVIQSLHDKHVKTFEARVEDEQRKYNAEKNEKAKAARKERKNNPEMQAKDEERKQIKARINQLKKEGKKDEALALAMQLRQGMDGELTQAVSTGMAAAQEETAVKTKFSDDKKKAYIIFLKELAKEPFFRTEIIIDLVGNSNDGVG